MQKKKTEAIVVDKRPTMAEWPVRIWAMEEIPEIFDLEARKSMKGTFNQYHMVYSPIRRTAPDSFEYMFGYGEGEIFYLKNEKNKVRRTVLKCSQIEEIYTQRELLNAKIIVKYKADLQDRELETMEFPYIPSVYYLYDPFLNWMLGLDQEFVPALAEQKHPRPEKLYKESPVMYNYVLAAYRLGDCIGDYKYTSEQHRHKWMPWKKVLEEWLEVPMSRGTFTLHSLEYLTECGYLELKNKNAAVQLKKQ